MIGNALFLLVMWAVSAFLANRLYVIIKYRSINIKGMTYSKVDTPIMYWVQMMLLACGLAVIGSIAVGMTLFYAGVLA
jgi:hypothetical protein